ncbi:DUF6286 domain-containing protein [Streptomyces sp. URMC 123]|uniref:DUF6286 domain-containing protein n=1 Tax=Streptomyces sp. URMC 123 TaxID=3423403 RepID=UPI003F1AC713
MSSPGAARASRDSLASRTAQGVPPAEGRDTPPSREPPPPHAPDEAAPGPRAHRFWSARRVPAGLIALAAAGGVGLLLYDVAAVRADRPAMCWRRRLARELASRPLDDPWMIGGAAAAVVLGVWLMVLALTPGLRQLLPMRRSGPEVRAGLDRSAAALVLRDRAMEVSGVRSVRVEVGRRKVRARALVHFRDLAEVERDLDETLTEGIHDLGLERRPRLSVRVRRPAKG